MIVVSCCPGLRMASDLSRVFHRLAACVLLVLALFGATNAAQAGLVKPADEFDHLATGFPLVGRHQLIPCESCHRDGVFQGLPKQCDGCHDGKTARGKHLAHIITIAQCDTCHTPRGFNISAIMDHTSTNARCETCHDGVQASGKSSGHVASTNNCAACHVSAAWTVINRLDHDELLPGARCFTCHNGKDAIGKSARHVASTNECAACHETNSFRPVRTVDHDQVIGTCGNLGCHIKPDKHMLSTNDCGSCHFAGTSFTNPDKFETPYGRIYQVETHTAVLPRTCNQVGCHGVGEATISISSVATPTPAGHIPTSASCDLCHTIFGWTPNTFTHDKLSIVSNCTLCHNPGVTLIRTKGKPVGHPATTGACEGCHLTTAPAWKTLAVQIDHNQALPTCAQCHNDVIAKGKDSVVPPHVATASDCGVCHKTTTWLGAAVDHTGFTNNCTTCHGVTASGKSGKHLKGLNTTDQCYLCHKVFPSLWADTLAFDHSQISPATACATCHDGTGTLAKTGKGATHIPTILACDACHTSQTTWLKPNVAVDHATLTSNCVSCHSGTLAGAVGKGGKHNNGLSTSNLCESCHRPKPTPWAPAFTFDHGQIQPPTPCATCHDGTGLRARTSKGATHIPTTQACDVCHGSTASWTAAVSVDHTTLTSNCVSCHSGAFTGVTGKGGKHNQGLNTNDLCEACHKPKPVLWTTATFDHAQIQPATACGACHDGTGLRARTGKSATHPLTGALCEACHVNTVWRPVTRVDHTQTTALCSRCHDGVIAAGKNIGHIATTSDCGVCHTTLAWKPASAVDHATIFDNCISCHNNTRASGKGGKHNQGLATSDLCEKCHLKLPSKWVDGIRFDHAQMVPVTLACTTCHGTGLAKTALPTAGHIPTLSLSCGACHTTNVWNPANTDHSLGGFDGNCVTCHSGAFSPPATGFSGAHTRGLTTSNLCDACHAKKPGAWAPVVAFNHIQTPLINSCVTCHDGTTLRAKTGKGAVHPLTSDFCDRCHGTTFIDWARPTAAGMNHGETGANCASSGCHINTLNSFPSHVAIKSPPNCVACHTTTSWSLVAFVDHNELASTTCISCHNGVEQIGKSSSVFHNTVSQITDNCVACHFIPPQAFSPNKENPFAHSETTARCASCHGDAAPAFASIRWKGASHLLSTDNCVGCHNQNSWTTVSFSHNELLGGASCNSCHLSNLPAGHCDILNLDCGDCHVTSGWLAGNPPDCPVTAPPPPPPGVPPPPPPGVPPPAVPPPPPPPPPPAMGGGMGGGM